MTKRPNPQNKRPRPDDNNRRYQPPSAQDNDPPLEKISVEPAERFPRVPPPEPRPPKNDPAPSPLKTAKTRRGARLANLLTGVLVVLTLAAAGGFVWASQNPYHPLNPLARPTPLPQIITATFLPATAPDPATAEPSPRPLNELLPSEAPQGEPTLGLPVAVDPAATPTPLGGATPPALTSADGFSFQVVGELVYTENDNERGCNWASVAGVVYDDDGEPLTGVGVRLTDVETGEPITVFSGSSSRFPDGFEYVVGGAPVTRGFMVGLVAASGVALSEEVMVVTSQRCSQNVVVVNFEEVGNE
jgi:hypothetical protein